MTFGLAAQARHTSRVADITAREKADTPRKRQVMIARFAVELDEDVNFLRYEILIHACRIHSGRIR